MRNERITLSAASILAHHEGERLLSTQEYLAATSDEIDFIHLIEELRSTILTADQDDVATKYLGENSYVLIGNPNNPSGDSTYVGSILQATACESFNHLLKKTQFFVEKLNEAFELVITADLTDYEENDEDL